MEIGHIYKKGKSYYLCVSGLMHLHFSVIILKDTFKMTMLLTSEEKDYTHIGKAIDAVKLLEIKKGE